MITITNLTKKYGRKIALDNLSLQIKPGVCGLLGPNGAGKTTLMRCLLGLLAYQGGKIHVDGRLLRQGGQLPAVGYLPQRFLLYRDLTVEDMLRYFANLKGLSKFRQDPAIRDCLETVNLAGHLHTTCRSLSGGMVRRLGIAQALLGQPDILIFDEPTAGLDPEERIRFKIILNQLPKDRTTILSTHIIDDVEGLCDTLAVLDHGQVRRSGPTTTIAAAAQGRIWEIPSGCDLPADAHILGIDYRGADSVRRILTCGSQMAIPDGRACQPTVEDGYMALIKPDIASGSGKEADPCSG